MKKIILGLAATAAIAASVALAAPANADDPAAPRTATFTMIQPAGDVRPVRQRVDARRAGHVNADGSFSGTGADQRRRRHRLDDQLPRDGHRQDQHRRHDQRHHRTDAPTARRGRLTTPIADGTHREPRHRGRLPRLQPEGPRHARWPTTRLSRSPRSATTATACPARPTRASRARTWRASPRSSPRSAPTAPATACSPSDHPHHSSVPGSLRRGRWSVRHPQDPLTTNVSRPGMPLVVRAFLVLDLDRSRQLRSGVSRGASGASSTGQARATLIGT